MNFENSSKRNWEKHSCLNATFYFTGTFSSLSQATLSGREKELSELVRLYKNNKLLFKKRIKAFHGFYAIVIIFPDLLVAVVDSVRSIPLYIYQENGTAKIKTDGFLQKRNPQLSLNKNEFLGYLHSGYTLGKSSLVKEFTQLESGSYCEIKQYGNKSEISFYDYNVPVEFSDLIVKNKSIEFKDIFYEKIIDFKNQCKEKKICVPLSGGWDSRVIVASLKNLGFEDVTCFTYGQKNDPEVSLSRQVAKALDYEWIFCEYTTQMWSEWFSENNFHEFSNSGCILTSIPVFQDLPAVQKLAQKFGGGENCVFIPGHSADFLAGSHIPQNFLLDKKYKKKSLVDAILENHYDLWPIYSYEYNCLSEFISTNLVFEENKIFTKNEIIRAYEEWDFKERQCKYIINSVRAYEYVGSDWYMPFWEPTIVELFYSLSLEDRIDCKFYYQTVLSEIFQDRAKVLGKIPIAGTFKTPEEYANSETRNKKYSPLQSKARSYFKRYLPFLRSLRKISNPSKPHKMGFHSWFTNGSDPSSIKFSDVAIADDFTELLDFKKRRFSNERITELDSLGMLSYFSGEYVMQRIKQNK